MQSRTGAGSWHKGKLHPAFFDRAVLVSILGEIHNREAAMKEIYDALKPGGMFSITEVVLDPHFQGCEAVLKIVQTVGFKKKKLFGNKWAYTNNWKNHLSKWTVKTTLATGEFLFHFNYYPNWKETLSHL